MGRSKIAPIKQQSIPCLELDAVVFGVRLSEFIRSSLRIPLSFVTFGTDSATVLTLIKSVFKQKTYVSHRIKENLEKQNLNSGNTYQAQPIRLIMTHAALKRKISKTSALTATVPAATSTGVGFENQKASVTRNERPKNIVQRIRHFTV